MFILSHENRRGKTHFIFRSIRYAYLQHNYYENKRNERTKNYEYVRTTFQHYIISLKI